MKILFTNEGYDTDGFKFKNVRLLDDKTSFALRRYERVYRGLKELAFCISNAATIFLKDIVSFQVDGREYQDSFNTIFAWDIISEITTKLANSVLNKELILIDKKTDENGKVTITINSTNECLD